MTIQFPPALFFFFKVEISWCTQIQLFRPRSVHSISAHCDRVFPDELCVSLFPDRSHTMPGQLQSQLIRTSLGQRCMHIESVTCHLHFWQNDQGLLRATAVTREWNRHRIRVSTHKVDSGEENSPRSLRDSNSQPFDHESGALTNKLFFLGQNFDFIDTD